MDEKKFGNALTVILIVLIVAILGILAYFGYSTFKGSQTQANADSALQEYKDKHKDKVNSSDTSNTSGDTTVLAPNPLDNLNPTEGNSSGTGSSTSDSDKVYMEGYEIIGSIKIPKTGIEYPILERQTTRSLELSVTKLHGVGINEIGNVTITGHNYRNGLFFSNNKKLKVGDDIYITDNSGTTIKYIIYSVYETSPDDAGYMRRDTNGKREISLSTCNDDSSRRLIILAAEQ